MDSKLEIVGAAVTPKGTLHSVCLTEKTIKKNFNLTHFSKSLSLDTFQNCRDIKCLKHIINYKSRQLSNGTNVGMTGTLTQLRIFQKLKYRDKVIKLNF